MSESEKASGLTPAELYEVMALFEFECCDELFWRVEGPGLMWTSVMCNDFFAWGCADCETVTADDLPMLTQAFADAREATGEEWESGGLLYCARKRQMRPQGACYSYLDKRLWPLFDACGPERETSMGNPVPAPAS